MLRLTAIFLLCVPVFGADWPQFLGPNRNGTTTSDGLAPAWPKDGPSVLWKRSVGQGFAGPAVAEGKLILFHRVGNDEVVEALDALSGKPLWKFAYATNYRDDFGFDEGPRGTPAIAGGRVFTHGAEGVLHALDLATGKRIWRVDTFPKFGVRKGFFGAACSPLVDGGRVLLNVGGPNGAGVVAFDAATGKVLWTATNDDASYAAPVAADIASERHALFFTRAGLTDLDPANGKVRFQFPWRSRSNASVNAAAPLVSGDLVFLSASYGTGAVLLQVSKSSAKQIWASDDVLSNHYATSVLRDGFLYGYHGRQEMGPTLRCVELKTGKVRWEEDGFRAGSISLAGDRLLLMREGGELVMAQATPSAFKPTARAKVVNGTVRAFPAIAGGILYVRNEDTLTALDLRASGR